MASPVCLERPNIYRKGFSDLANEIYLASVFQDHIPDKISDHDIQDLREKKLQPVHPGSVYTFIKWVYDAVINYISSFFEASQDKEKQLLRTLHAMKNNGFISMDTYIVLSRALNKKDVFIAQTKLVLKRSLNEGFLYEKLHGKLLKVLEEEGDSYFVWSFIYNLSLLSEVNQNEQGIALSPSEAIDLGKLHKEFQETLLFSDRFSEDLKILTGRVAVRKWIDTLKYKEGVAIDSLKEALDNKSNTEAKVAIAEILKFLRDERSKDSLIHAYYNEMLQSFLAYEGTDSISFFSEMLKSEFKVRNSIKQLEALYQSVAKRNEETVPLGETLNALKKAFSHLMEEERRFMGSQTAISVLSGELQEVYYKLSTLQTASVSNDVLEGFDSRTERSKYVEAKRVEVQLERDSAKLLVVGEECNEELLDSVEATKVFVSFQKEKEVYIEENDPELSFYSNYYRSFSKDSYARAIIDTFCKVAKTEFFSYKEAVVYHQILRENPDIILVQNSEDFEVYKKVGKQLNIEVVRLRDNAAWGSFVSNCEVKLVQAREKKSDGKYLERREEFLQGLFNLERMSNPVQRNRYFGMQQLFRDQLHQATVKMECLFDPDIDSAYIATGNFKYDRKNNMFVMTDSFSEREVHVIVNRLINEIDVKENLSDTKVEDILFITGKYLKNLDTKIKDKRIKNPELIKKIILLDQLRIEQTLNTPDEKYRRLLELLKQPLPSLDLEVQDIVEELKGMLKTDAAKNLLGKWMSLKTSIARKKGTEDCVINEIDAIKSFVCAPLSMHFILNMHLHKFLSTFNHTLQFDSASKDLKILMDGVYQEVGPLCSRYDYTQRRIVDKASGQSMKYTERLGFSVGALDVWTDDKLPVFKTKTERKTKDYRLEIVTDAGDNEDHSWVRLRTPEGEVYSVGKFWDIDSKHNFFQQLGTIPATLQAGDVHEYMGREVKLKVTKKTITKRQFDDIKDFIEKEQKKCKEEQSAYNLISQNCASFTVEVAKLAGIDINARMNIFDLIVDVPFPIRKYLYTHPKVRKAIGITTYPLTVLRNFLMLALGAASYKGKPGLRNFLVLNSLADLFNEIKLTPQHPKQIRLWQQLVEDGTIEIND